MRAKFLFRVTLIRQLIDNSDHLQVSIRIDKLPTTPAMPVLTGYLNRIYSAHSKNKTKL